MSKSKQNAISPTRAENYPEWYQQVVKAADLAEPSTVRGCMVIKPWGFALWEHMQAALDKMFKDTGHVNAYFPLFIPLSYLEKEADHVEGFAKECAVVTHHRLVDDGKGGLRPDGELDEPLIVRPTSETIIGETYAKWVQSYRDLPILINQWANVVRWEMRTRLFIRTAEFLWQEGHTVHATEAEAVEETLQMLDVYETFAQEFLAMPVIKGEKTSDERFPGAVNTYCIEAMMQDGKALQAGTSHFLGQNFAKACGIKFLNQNEKEETAWTTSWGVSTRLIGGLIMTHSDDDGLRLPPRIAPKQIVIMPVLRGDQNQSEVLSFCEDLKQQLEDTNAFGQSLRVEIDKRDIRGKNWVHIKRGVPLRVEVGPRDIAAGKICLSRRDQSAKDKSFPTVQEFVGSAGATLEAMQTGMYEKALAFRQSRTVECGSLAAFEEYFRDANAEESGFAHCLAADDPEMVAKAKALKVTARCLPSADSSSGACIFTGKPAMGKVVFGRSY